MARKSVSIDSAVLEQFESFLKDKGVFTTRSECVEKCLKSFIEQENPSLESSCSAETTTETVNPELNLPLLDDSLNTVLINLETVKEESTLAWVAYAIANYAIALKAQRYTFEVKLLKLRSLEVDHTCTYPWFILENIHGALKNADSSVMEKYGGHITGLTQLVEAELVKCKEEGYKLPNQLLEFVSIGKELMPTL